MCIYTAHAAIELYAEVFDAAGVSIGWKRLPAFMVPTSTDCLETGPRITLERAEWSVPESLALTTTWLSRFVAEKL